MGLASKILYTLSTLKQYSDFKKSQPPAVSNIPFDQSGSGKTEKNDGPTGLGLNLSYTINLNLPAATDQAVS